MSLNSRKECAYWRNTLSWLLTLLVGLVGGYICFRLTTPIPWMIGPLVATAAARLSGIDLTMPVAARNAGQWVIGMALGLYFTPTVVSELLPLAVPVITGAIFALLLGAFSGVLLSRISAQDHRTCYFSTMPGGASEMTNLAEQYGARVDLVAAAHSLRIMLVVIIVPGVFVALDLHGLDNSQLRSELLPVSKLLMLMLATLPGVMIWKYIKQPNPWVLGALLVTALLAAMDVVSGVLPGVIVAAGQVLIGCSLGCRFSRDFFRVAFRYLLGVALVSLVMMLMAAAFSALLAWVSKLPISSVVLGLSPGGISEMCITAQALHLAVPVVTAFHVIRMLGVVTLAAPLFTRLYMRD